MCIICFIICPLIFVKNIGKMVEDNRSQKQVELELEVLQACRETAKSFRGSVKENANRRNIRLHVISSNPIEHEKLRAIITADSSLGSCRFNSLGEYVPDGFTPLHLAASLGNNSTLSILLECPGVSAWCRDLQGRTPLHIAVKHGKVDTCELLRKRMEEERYDPVGVNAPVDLTGNTPLGWAGMGTSCPNLPLFMPARLQTGPITPHTTPVRNAIRAALDATPERTPPPAASSTTPLANPTFLLGIGDSSILPRSPLVERGGGTATGLSPLNSSINTNTSISRPRPPIPPVGTSITEDPVASLTDALASACSVSYSSFASTTLPTETSDLPMVVYGFGEASGWRPYMEDRIVHGALSHFLTNAATGSATSATSTVTATLSGAEGLTESYVFGILDGHGGDFSVNHVSKHLPSHLATGFSTVSANRNLSIDVLEETMISSFLQVDAQLGSLGRMQPQTSNKGVVTYLDESGSTGCVCVVTPEHIICGNVGDSRAVLGSICGVVDQQDIGLGQSQDAMHTPEKLRPVSAAATAGPGFPAHMLCRRFEARDLSTDHKPEIPSECMRIEAAGGG